MQNPNTASPDDLIKTLEPDYRMTPYLMLRGHIAFKAALQVGQFLTKYENLYGSMHPQEAAQAKSDDEDRRELLEQGGMSAKDTWWDDICGLVEYANKLTFDMQQLDDPNGTKRIEPSYKRMGIWFNQNQRADSWAEMVELVARSQSEQTVDTYDQYVAARRPGEAPITEEQWFEEGYTAYVRSIGENFALSKKLWVYIHKNHVNLYQKFDDEIVDALMAIGYQEVDFDQLSIRNQIACIENMRTKVDRMVEAAAKSTNFKRGVTAEQKTLEATAIAGVIRGFDAELCAMLNSSRYANYAEFMRNFIPGAAKSEIISRALLIKQEHDLMNSKPKLSDEDMAKANSDFLDMENDMPI